MWKSFGVTLAALMIVALPAASPAQELNTRSDAPPGAKAVTGRLMSKTRSTTAGTGQDLSRDVINTDCSDMNIGGPMNQGPGGKPKDNATVIRGNVVNLCR